MEKYSLLILYIRIYRPGSQDHHRSASSSTTLRSLTTSRTSTLPTTEPSTTVRTTTTTSTTVKFEVFYDISFDQDTFDVGDSSEEIIAETTDNVESEDEVIVDSEILRNLSLNLPDMREALNLRK